MFKRLAKDASLYSLSSLISRGLSLITVPLFTRVLSPADYGALDLLSILMVLAPMILGLAMDQAVARFYLDAKDELEKKRIASTVLIYNVLIIALLIPLAWPATAWIADVWLDGQIERGTAVMVFIYIWIHSIFITGNNQLRYQFKSKQYAMCHIGNVLLSTALSVLFVFFLGWGVFGVIFGQSIGQLIFGLLSVYLGRESYSLLFHLPSLGKMLSYSLPLVPSTLSFYGMQVLDRIFLNELRELQDVGLYSMGSRLASLVNLFLMGFHGAWSPMVMKTFREEGAKEKFRTVFNYYLFTTLMILAGLSLFSEEVLIVLTTTEFIGGYVVVPLLVLSAVLASIAAYFTFGIQIEKKSNYRLAINVMALIINCTLNLVLIPRFGIIGAALATCLSYAFLAMAGMVISQRLYYVSYRWGRIFFAILLSSVVSVFVIVVDVPVSLIFIIAKMLAALGLLIALVWLLNIRYRELLSGGLFRKRAESGS